MITLSIQSNKIGIESSWEQESFSYCDIEDFVSEFYRENFGIARTMSNDDALTLSFEKVVVLDDHVTIEISHQ